MAESEAIGPAGEAFGDTALEASRRYAPSAQTCFESRACWPTRAASNRKCQMGCVSRLREQAAMKREVGREGQLKGNARAKAGGPPAQVKERSEQARRHREKTNIVSNDIVYTIKRSVRKIKTLYEREAEAVSESMRFMFVSIFLLRGNCKNSFEQESRELNGTNSAMGWQ